MNTYLKATPDRPRNKQKHGMIETVSTKVQILDKKYREKNIEMLQ